MAHQTVTVANHSLLRQSINEYASRGFVKQFEHDGAVTMARKKPFNWVLAIICLFIPVIGWIALIGMIIAAGRGSEVVEISIDPQPAGSAA